MSKSASKKGIALAVIFFVVLVIWQAPATLVVWAIKQQVPDIEVRLVGGTVWRGQLGLVDWPTGNDPLQLDKIHWRLNALSLLSLSPSAYVELASGPNTLSGTFKVSASQALQVTGLELAFNGEFLRNFVPALVDGLFTANIPSMLVRNQKIEALEGVIEWQQGAVTAGTGQIPLGDFQALLDEDAKGGFYATLMDMGGPVGLNGSLNADLQRSYSIQSIITLRAEADPQLNEWLPLFTLQRSADEYFFVASGSYR